MPSLSPTYKIVVEALNRATKYDFKPKVWTYTNDNGTETVIFEFLSPSTAKFIYKKHKKFLWIDYGHETFTLNAESLASYEDWIAASSAVDDANHRFGAF